MGCGSSGAAGEGAEDFNNDLHRKKVGGSNRKNKDDDGDDFFEVEEATGEQFMATKPWIGQIEEPDNHNPVNNEKPD